MSPQSGERWQHYKGGEYEIIAGDAIDTNAKLGTDNRRVIYRNENGTFVRPLSEWSMIVRRDNFCGTRFRKIAPSPSDAEREIASWKAAHDEMVRRNALLRTRPDLPAERLAVHDELVARIAELTRERDEAKRENERLRAACEIARDDYKASHSKGARRLRRETIEGYLDAALAPVSGAAEREEPTDAR